MKEWIKKSDAIEAVSISCRTCLARDIEDCKKCSVPKLRELINAIPSADRPRGEWIDMGDFEQCSACKGTRLKEFQSYYGKVTWIKTPYCPNCGARMKGADDE